MVIYDIWRGYIAGKKYERRFILRLMLEFEELMVKTLEICDICLMHIYGGFIVIYDLSLRCMLKLWEFMEISNL